METTRTRTSAPSAIAALRALQTDYPDYDADDWLRAVEDAFKVATVRSVARALAGLADWSLRGIQVTQERLSKRAGVSKGSVPRAITKLVDAGYLVVSKRPVRKTSNGYTQYPNSYRLVIPEAPTWDMPPWDASDVFETYVPEDAGELPSWAEDSADASADRSYWDQVNRLAGGSDDPRDMRVPHAWTWLDTGWITQSNGPFIVVKNLNYSEAWPESMVTVCPHCEQPHMSDGLCSWCLDGD